jgi:hypothetical protein
MWGWLLTIGLAQPAHALEVVRSREGEWVVVRAAMQHGPDQISALLAKHGQTMQLGKGVRSVEARPIENGCAHLTVQNRGLARDLAYTAERCPIANGWHSKLLESEDFSEHQIIWTTEPEGGGSRVTIRVKVQLKAPVPDFIVQRIVAGALEGTLEKMDEMLSG